MVLARIGWGWFWRGCKKVQKKCKKMQDYLHISNIFRTFAADLEIVPSITLKKGNNMENECVFKIEYKGDLYKVVKHPYNYAGTVFVFKVMHKRRVLGKFKSTDDRGAIEFAMACAFGVGVTINAGSVL